MPEEQLGDGRYVVTRKIGAGGTADVYQATDTRLGRQVAVKLIHQRLADDPVLRARIEAEVRVCRSLDHPGIVAVYDYQSSATPPYIVMEYMAGGDLRRRLLQVGILPPSEVRRIAEALGEALSAAHHSGIIHRDIKPRNVLFSEAGLPKIADFGLAQSATAAGLSRRATIAGTPEYTAPEALTANLNDARTDLYGLGCTLYEALTGRPPFSANTPSEVLRMQIEEVPAPLPSELAATDPNLALLVVRLLEKEPNARPQTAEEALSLLKEDEPGVSTLWASAGSTHESACPRCRARLSADYPWCFDCGAPRAPVARRRRGGVSILVTGPGRPGEKASPEVRDGCCKVVESAGLESANLRKRIPRFPFVLTHNVDPAGAARLREELAQAGIEVAVTGHHSDRLTLVRAIVRKTFTMAPRVYLVFVGMSMGLFNAVTRMPPLAAAGFLGAIVVGVPAVLGAVYARSLGRWAKDRATVPEGNVNELLSTSTDPLIHARMKSIADIISTIRGAALARETFTAAEREAIEHNMSLVLDRSAAFCLALEKIRGGSALLDGSIDFGDAAARPPDVDQTMEIVRGFERTYTRTLELLGRSVLELRELAMRIVHAQTSEARRTVAGLRAVNERLGDESEAWQELIGAAKNGDAT